MHYLLLLLLPLIVLSKPYKIATYNVENLFDAFFQGSEYEEYIPGRHNWNSRMVEIKLSRTAEVICDLDADIIALQEIENRRIVNQLITLLKKVGCAYNYSAVTSKKGAPIQVALLSRYPLKKQKDIVVNYSPKVRNILEVDVKLGHNSVKLFVNHWKSKAYKGYESKRIAYAKALQARIAKLSFDKEYVLLGDFNSDYNAYLTLDEKLNDTGGKTAFSDILKTRIEEYEMPRAKPQWHYTLWKELEPTERWSQKFFGKKSTPDQIVLPRQMFDGKGIDYVNNSFGVFKAKYLFTKRGYINRWRYKKGKHMAKGYSDHLPVYAYFDTKPYRKGGDRTEDSRKTRTIEFLYHVESLQGKIELKDVVVILKRGVHAIVKQHPYGRGIMLYGCASKLKEGYRYDLLVDAIKSYRGLKEITSVYTLKQKGKIDTSPYLKDISGLDRLEQNEVIRNIKGIYKNRHLYVGELKIPLYFKKKKLMPKNGSKLKIDYAHLGYYKRLQLVIYSKKDFRIME